jgi:hypothetical protein
MAITQVAGMEISGPVGTVGDVRAFLAAIGEYEVSDETIIDGYLEFRATGIPTPAGGGASIVFTESGQ